MTDDYIGGYSPTEQENIELECQADKLEEENERLAKRICELQSDLAKAKSQIEKTKSCSICKHRNKGNRGVCISNGTCKNKDKWELAE